jgi:hypothetical protein
MELRREFSNGGMMQVNMFALKLNYTIMIDQLNEIPRNIYVFSTSF